jgi:SNF2 family DNA or RNA helicase
LVKFDKVHRGKIYGKQKRDERARSVQLLDPRATPDAPVVVIGTPATGSMGLNLTAAHTVLYMSNDFSYKTRKQSEDRVHRPGQIHPVSYFDMIATGPNGQKTIDHTVIKALLNKQGLADMTTSAWLDILSD